jgi:lysozyme
MLVRSLLVTLGVLVLAAGILAGAYRLGWLRFSYPDSDEYPVLGIDVSHHQGAIDWSLVSTAEVSFAFIKSSEGATLQDSRFATNAADARGAGIPWGPYHFFTFCTPGAAQASNFRTTAAPLARDLPPVVDIEFVGNCRGWTSMKAVRHELKIFLSQVERNFGEKPILYVTRESEEDVLAGDFPDYSRWPRSIFGRPSKAVWDRWAVWQFADNARLPGIPGPVDLDVYCCSRAEFAARKYP